MASLTKLTLQKRISLLVLGGLAVGLGLFSWLGIQSLNESTERILSERLTVARIMAADLDETLGHILVHLQNAARFPGELTEKEQFTTAAASLNQILAESGIVTENSVLIDREGKVIQIQPENEALIGTDMSRYQEINEALETKLPTLSNLVNSPLTETPVVLATAPILDGEGNVIGALVSSIGIEQWSHSAFSRPVTVGNTGYTEIVDGNGIVLARTSPGGTPQMFEKSDMLAFAPLTTVSWGIVIRQAEEEALAPTRQLGRRFLLLGIVMLVGTFSMVWLMMQGIVRPIKVLTAATKRVAGGDLKAIDPVKRQDEIGELSTAFRTMTEKLAWSRDELVRRNQKLSALYQEAKRKETLRGQLLNSVITAQEEERKRIARELHDEYGQTLTGVIMSLESLENMLPPKKSLLKEKLEKTRALVVRALDDMRKLTFDLRPSVLDDLGLLAAIRTHIQTHLTARGITVTFESQGMRKRLAPAVETTLFRIIQEAIHNIIKHAEARHVSIQLRVKGNQVTASVADDGNGFDVDAVFRDKVGVQSLGLLGIQERATLLGGTFSIKSPVGQGTHLTVEIPLAGSIGEPKPDKTGQERAGAGMNPGRLITGGKPDE